MKFPFKIIFTIEPTNILHFFAAFGGMSLYCLFFKYLIGWPDFLTFRVGIGCCLSATAAWELQDALKAGFEEEPEGASIPDAICNFLGMSLAFIIIL